MSKKLTKNGEKYHEPTGNLNHSPAPYTGYTKQSSVLSEHTFQLRNQIPRPNA
jgi:hypothetical protein